MPVRDEGRLTRNLGTAFVTLGGLCILVRFLARWRIQGNSIGSDDWAILGAYLLTIPSTIFVKISKAVTHVHISTRTLTGNPSDGERYGPRHLECGV